MSRQWEGTTLSDVVQGGQKVVVACRCPPRCQLYKLSVEQLTGTAVAFNVNVFSSLVAAEAYVAGTLTSPNRVTDQVASDSVGKLLHFFNWPEGAYENKDGGPSNKQYRIYVVVEPSGVQAGLTFEVVVGVLLEADSD